MESTEAKVVHDHDYCFTKEKESATVEPVVENVPEPAAPSSSPNSSFNCISPTHSCDSGIIDSFASDLAQEFGKGGNNLLDLLLDEDLYLELNGEAEENQKENGTGNHPTAAVVPNKNLNATPTQTSNSLPMNAPQKNLNAVNASPTNTPPRNAPPTSRSVPRRGVLPPGTLPPRGVPLRQPRNNIPPKPGEVIYGDRKKDNAEAARENRRKKKAYILGLEKEVTQLRAEKNVLTGKSFQLEGKVKELSEEVEYLKSILANESMLSKLIERVNPVVSLSTFCSSRQTAQTDSESGKENTVSTRSRKRAYNSQKATQQQNESDKRSRKSGSGGVCLHVKDNKVSLEFCHICSKKAAN